MRLITFSKLTLTALAAVAVLPACIIADPGPPPDPYGDLAFDWSFDGESDCATANVDNVDVVISQAGEVVLEDDNEPCTGGGLVITAIHEGVYDVDVVAFDHNGVANYQTSFTIHVFGGQTNDAGVVSFAPIGDPPPPPPSEGTLAFFWRFLYPTDGNTVEDCALAGVDSVDVFVTPQGTQGEAFEQTSTCDAQHQGLDISHLNEGRYTIRLQAHGSYDGNDVMLYDSGDITVDVLADQTTDLGNVDMGRVNASFSDFDVAWTLAGDTCDGAGIQNVTLSFQRDGFGAPEDSFDVDCGAANVVRHTFVPGHYTVTGVAHGTTTTFTASVPVGLAPNSVGQVDLALAP